MKKNERNYWNWALVLILLYFALLALIRAHEQVQSHLKLNPDVPYTVNAGWYVLIFLLGMGAFAAAAWWVVSKHNEVSIGAVFGRSFKKTVSGNMKKQTKAHSVSDQAAENQKAVNSAEKMQPEMDQPEQSQKVCDDSAFASQPDGGTEEALAVLKEALAQESLNAAGAENQTSETADQQQNPDGASKTDSTPIIPAALQAEKAQTNTHSDQSQIQAGNTADAAESSADLLQAQPVEQMQASSEPADFQEETISAEQTALESTDQPQTKKMNAGNEDNKSDNREKEKPKGIQRRKAQCSVIFAGLAGGALCAFASSFVIGSSGFSIQLPQFEHQQTADAAEEQQPAEDGYQFPIPDMPPVKPVDNLITQAAGNVVVSDTQTISGWQSCDLADTSVILAADQSQLTLLQANVNKLGGQQNPADAAAYGLNSAVLVAPGGTVNMLGGSIQANGEGAGAAAVNGLNASMTLADAQLQTSGISSPAVLAAFQGQMHLRQCQVYTTASDSPSMISRAGSSITADSVITQTESSGSPIIVAAGSLTANTLNANAMNSSLALLRPGSEVTINTSDVSANAGSAGDDNTGMFVFAAADTAKTDPARLTLSSSEVTFNPTSPLLSSAPLFRMVSCPASITLSQSTLTTPSGILTSAAASKVSITLDAQGLYGRMQADGASTLEVIVRNGSQFAGSINAENTCPNASLSLDASSKMTLTADMYLTSFTNEDAANTNITSSGFHIYVNGEQIL